MDVNPRPLDIVFAFQGHKKNERKFGQLTTHERADTAAVPSPQVDGADRL